MERSAELASRRGRASAGTEHLLLGMFWEPGGIGDRVLGELGVPYGEATERPVELGAMDELPNPREIPGPYREREYGESVGVLGEDSSVVLSGLRKNLPPGTPLAFDHEDEEHSRIRAGKGVDLGPEVRKALADAGRRPPP